MELSSSVKTENLFFVLSSEVQVNEQIRDFSLLHFLKVSQILWKCKWTFMDIKLKLMKQEGPVGLGKGNPNLFI